MKIEDLLKAVDMELDAQKKRYWVVPFSTQTLKDILILSEQIWKKRLASEKQEKRRKRSLA